tara:strand:+ start:254 stop:637 length:384 start_codon:yes stop_codon:yes gene_type:complete
MLFVWKPHGWPEGQKPDLTRCRASVAADRIGHYQCSRKVVFEEKFEGKLYGWCKQHRPSAVKAREQAQRVKWRAEWEADKRRGKRFDARARVATIAIRHFRQEASFDELEAAVLKYEALENDGGMDV